MNFLLILHVAAGFVALIVGPCAMLTVKGLLWHRRWGKIFVGAMSVVAASAVPLAIHHWNPFLLMISAFSFYLTLSGYEVLGRKSENASPKARNLAIACIALGLLSSVGLGLYSFNQLEARNRSMAIVGMAFSLISFQLSISQIRSLSEGKATQWFQAHMNRMLAAYIATVSAFSVVNFTFLPEVIRWLWPTVIGGVAIAAWNRAYRTKS